MESEDSLRGRSVPDPSARYARSNWADCQTQAAEWDSAWTAAQAALREGVFAFASVPDSGRAPPSLAKRKAAERSRTAPTDRARLEAAGPCSRDSSGCKSIPSPPRVGNWSYWQHAVISTGLVTSKRDTGSCMRKKSENLRLTKRTKSEILRTCFEAGYVSSSLHYGARFSDSAPPRFTNSRITLS